MTTYDEAHASGCPLCQDQLARAGPFHKDLCHMNIRPGDDYGELPPIQCPHIRWQDASLCEHHLTRAAESYRKLVTRTAPFN